MDILKVLLIEDNPGDARFIGEMLVQGLGANHWVKWAQRLSDGLILLANEPFDVLLLDLSLPDSHGLTTLEQIHPSYPALPVVVLTGLDDEKRGLESIHKGAEDYLVKGKTESQLLVKSLRYAIERRRAAEALNAKEQENTRLEVLRQTAVAMAHHIRNAITPVCIMAHLYDSGKPEDAIELKQITLAQSLRIAAIIDALVEMAETGNIPTMHYLSENNKKMLDMEPLIEHYLGKRRQS